MAQKRKAQEAFGKSSARLSAFAAAKLARESKFAASSHDSGVEWTPEEDLTATDVAFIPYDNERAGTSTPELRSLEEDLAIATPTRRPVVTFSTFVPTHDNVLTDDDECLQLNLHQNETIVLVGEYDVEIVKSGAAFIAGTVLHSNSGSQRVYAPSTHALPQIRSLQDRTIIRVTSIKSGLRKLEKLSPLFRSLWLHDSAKGRSFTLLRSSDDAALQHSLNVLEVDKDVDAVLRNISSQMSTSRSLRIMTTGAKSSGKSTFNRLLCNYFHTTSQGSRLQYLDIDPGQPEFGTPGQLSLVEVTAPIHGPPFTHPTSAKSSSFKLIRSHTIAAMTFKDDPAHYKACVDDLMQHVDERSPLIVNTCGWVSGLGASVLAGLMAMLAISHAVLLEPLELSLSDSLRGELPKTAFYQVARRAPKSSSRTPAENRAMQTMAYFHQRLDPNTGMLRWSGKPIAKMRPWIVSYAGDNAGIFAIISYGQSPNAEFLAEVLDGSVVAIVVLERRSDSTSMYLTNYATDTPPHTLDAHLANSVQRTVEDLPYIPPNSDGVNSMLNPGASHCIGLALVRGIDIERKELHLVTPLLESEIAELKDKQVVLVRGSFDPPGWAYLEDLYKAGDESGSNFKDQTRPWVSRRDTAGIEGSVWRLRHPPICR